MNNLALSRTAGFPQPRWWRLLRESIPTVFAQAGVQIAGFLTGLILIRSLTVTEYAFYTLANAVLGTLTVLSDSGIGQGVLAEAGKVWNDPKALGGVLAAGMWLRRRMALLALLLALPLSYFLLRRQGAASTSAVLICLSIVPLFVSSLTGQLLQVVPRLHQQIRTLQVWQLLCAIARIVLTAIVVMLCPWTWLVIGCAGAAQAYLSWQTRRLAAERADLSAPPNLAARREIQRLVRSNCVNAAYYAFESQITIWLISIFGRTHGIAQVGALSRLNMAFTILSSTFALIVIPRFARLAASHRILRHYGAMQLGMLAVLSLIVGFVACFPQVPLWLLGPSYGQLTREVVLSIAGGALTVMSGCAYLGAAARSVVLTPWVVVPLALVMQAVLIYLLPVGTVAGLLWLTILTNLVFWASHVVNFAWHIRGDIR